MRLFQHERAAILIDGVNLHASAAALGSDIDFRRLLAFFQDRCQLMRAVYYGTLLSDEDCAAFGPLLHWLSYNGFTVVKKRARPYKAEVLQQRDSGSLHVEMCVDALRFSSELEHIVVFAGDNDLRALVEALQGEGKRVTVISTRKSHPTMIGDELRRQADEFIELADLRCDLCRLPTRREGPQSRTCQN